MPVHTTANPATHLPRPHLQRGAPGALSLQLLQGGLVERHGIGSLGHGGRRSRLLLLLLLWSQRLARRRLCPLLLLLASAGVGGGGGVGSAATCAECLHLL